MTRITTTIFIFLILSNGTVSVMEASGLNDDMGVALAPGISESMDSAIDNLREGFSPSAGATDTLFTLFITAIDIFNIVIDAVTATPEMFLNLGFPAWIVFPIFTPMYVISVFEVIYVGTGRDLV